MKKFLLVSLILIGLLTGLFTSVYKTFISEDYVDSTHGTFGYINKVYAGVKFEAGIVSLCFAGTGWEFITCPAALLMASGMPSSFVADTLFLPYTITSKQRNEEQHQKCIANKNRQGRDDDFWCTKKY